MINVEKNSHIKKFLIKKSIQEAVYLSKLSHKEFIYSIKIDLPNEVTLIGKKIIFQGIIFKLLKNATKTYSFNDFRNKIILITATMESFNRISFSVTSGGKGVSFLEKTIGKKSLLVFRDKNSNNYIYQIKQTLKKEFRGNLEIITKKNKGSTFKCYFPLNQ